MNCTSNANWIKAIVLHVKLCPKENKTIGKHINNALTKELITILLMASLIRSSGQDIMMGDSGDIPFLM